MRFDPQERPAPAWQAFGAYRFVLPRFEVRRRRDDVALVCNLRLPWDYARLDDILTEIESLSFPGPSLRTMMPFPLSREDSPALDEWRCNIEWALAAFTQTTLKKVVFAREASFGFEEAIDPVVLLHQLKGATPECFHFLVQPVEGVAFVGASPELLFSRQGRFVESEAVAGTRPRGESATDDARLLEELLQSDKERREHEYVRISIQETLGSLCETFHIDTDPSEMKLARGRHLVSHVRGTLREGVTSLDVLQALHPTPAVGGYPAEEAIEAIRACEHFDRGWYAGPVGWIGPDAAEFAVGIRTGLVHDRRLSLYSGAGIVPGSTPDAEWREIEHKISDFINVLGLDLYRAKY